MASQFWKNFCILECFVCPPFLIAYKSEALHEILHVYILEFIPFIILLWTLFTIAGGILISGAPVGVPFNNLILMGIGTGLASWIGTTGAAMVLIRPLIRMNQYRKSKVHLIVFFIFSSIPARSLFVAYFFLRIVFRTNSIGSCFL